MSNIVIVDFHVDPAGLLCRFFDGHAVAPVIDFSDGEKLLRCGVDTAVELPSKQINSHDAEDEPKNQAHQ